MKRIVSFWIKSSLLHTVQYLSFSIKLTYLRWVQVGAFFLAVHSLLSTLIYGYVPTQPQFFSNNKAYSKLPISFNDSLRISLCFLHFIYSLGATFDINTMHSTCIVFGNISTHDISFNIYPFSLNIL